MEVLLNKTTNLNAFRHRKGINGQPRYLGHALEINFHSINEKKRFIKELYFLKLFRPSEGSVELRSGRLKMVSELVETIDHQPETRLYVSAPVSQTPMVAMIFLTSDGEIVIEYRFT